jgi:5'-phosphate synthase pdxT subunit
LVNATPRIGVLALQGDVAEHAAALSRVGADAVAVRRLADLESVAGLVIPGGESTTISLLLETFELLQPIRSARAAGMPMLGSCAGMILLADRVLDGRPDQRQIGGIDITVRRNAFGRQVDSFEAPVRIAEVGDGPVDAIFIRAPWVESAGAAVEVLGEVEGGPAAGRIVAVRQGCLMATAFHPELGTDDRIHALFVDSVRTR